MLMGVKPVKQGRADIADMQQSGRRRRYANERCHAIVLAGFLLIHRVMSHNCETIKPSLFLLQDIGKNMKNDNDTLSLADTLAGVTWHTSNDAFGQRTAIVVAKLVGTGTSASELPVPQFHYNDSLINLVAKTRRIPDTAILSALRDVPLPFQSFWFAGPALDCSTMLENENGDWTLGGARFGFLCFKKDEQILVANALDIPTSELKNTYKHDAIPDQTYKGRFVLTPSLHTISADKIDFFEKDTEKNDPFYLSSVSFLARALLVMRSGIAPDIWQPETPKEEKQRRDDYVNNVQRRQMKRLPKFRQRPLVVDLTKTNFSNSSRLPKNIGELLGKIRIGVSRAWKSHKTGEYMRTKAGNLIFTKEHDRGTRSPGQRGAIREVTARLPATLDLSPEYPTLRIEKTDTTPKNE
jgi:hypothetical protein